jgi:predicted nucleic acid-binding protein
MAIKIFVDTNVLIDFVDVTRAHHLEAFKLIKLTITNDIELFLSESVITTADFILQKTLNADLLRELQTELMYTFTMLSCTNIIVTQALKTKPLDLEDAILYEIALQNKLDYFVTNDKQALKKLQNSNLPVVTSKQMVKMISM